MTCCSLQFVFGIKHSCTQSHYFTNTPRIPKKRSVEDTAEELDVPTKVFAFSSSEYQRLTKDSYPHLHQNEIYCSNNSCNWKYSKLFIKVGFMCILRNDEFMMSEVVV